MQEYLTRYVTDDSLIIILGDHQPAPLITGEGASRSVPVHVISRDPELLAPFEEWGFIPGMVPKTGPATLPMEAVPRPLPGRLQRPRNRLTRRPACPSARSHSPPSLPAPPALG